MELAREGILRLRGENPTMRAAQIARELGVSRARIGQLLPKLGLPTRFSEARACESCGELYYPPRSGSPLCVGCRRAAKYTILKCAVCGGSFGKRTKQLEWERLHRSRKLVNVHFHNKVCFGKYAAAHWGWGPQQRKKEQLSA